jgi:hypothetical protein
MAGANGMGSRGNVRAYCRRGVAAGVVPRTFGFARRALIALRESELAWQIVYTSPSLTGVRAAALAGLAITPLPASAIVAGLRVLGVESGLPLLPDLEFAIFERKRPDAAAAALTAVLVSLGQTAVRPTPAKATFFRSRLTCRFAGRKPGGCCMVSSVALKCQDTDVHLSSEGNRWCELCDPLDHFIILHGTV